MKMTFIGFYIAIQNDLYCSGSLFIFFFKSKWQKKKYNVILQVSNPLSHSIFLLEFC